jgi:hypothetical protein
MPTEVRKWWIGEMQREREPRDAAAERGRATRG